MAAANDTASMALFCDFENIALGVRDAQYEKFDIRPVLERLLAKGSIVVKKAYCDWDRYKGFKSAMHEANFELIEIPHVRQSGKNSADIRMVVDALDLCYTKAHVDTFVIISGDSDFSPLVSKLRENAKKVIGVGVKQSCSDLLITNCDEFIYYDDLVRDREAARAGQRREREKRSPEEEARRSAKQEERKNKGIEIVAATFVDLIADRGDSERIWASVLKEVVKRRNPGFNESYYGFRSFGNLLEEAANRGLLGFGRDDKGAYVFRAPAKPPVVDGESENVPVDAPVAEDNPIAGNAKNEPESENPTPEGGEKSDDKSASSRRRGGRRTRGGRDRGDRQNADSAPSAEADAEFPAAAPDVAPERVTPVSEASAAQPAVEMAAVAEERAESPDAKPRRTRTPRRPAKAKADKADKADAAPVAVEASPATVVAAVAESPAAEVATKPARARRTPRSPKKKSGDSADS